MDLEVELLCDCRAELGEGPMWDSWTETLWWVDIDRRQLWGKPSGRPAAAYDLGRQLSAVLPRRDGGLVLVARRAIILTDPTLTVTGLVQVPLPIDERLRLNDAACDPAGRLWFGTMATDGRLDQGSLYCLDIDHTLSRVLSPVSISNGLAWSPDARTLYYVDTPTGRVDAFTFDPQAGRLEERRPFARIPEAEGRPDGLTVDADGTVWVAVWGGGAIIRLTESGARCGAVRLPTPNVTSCCFGGDRLQELFATTARRGLTSTELAAQPTAGAVFACRPGARGLPPARFGG